MHEWNKLVKILSFCFCAWIWW